MLIQCIRRLAGALYFILLLSGCASAWQTDKLRSEPPAALPALHELTQTPFYPQQQYQCGPAALATVLNHYTVGATPDNLVSQIYVPGREGSLQIEMVTAARQHGMLVYPLRPKMADLLSEVAAGHPVLVLQNLSFGWLPVWHYAVVVGYDLANSEVILRSGTTRRWITSLAAFERTWARANYWGLVILPPSRIPDTAEPLRYLNSALELEQTSQQKAAYQAYQAAASRWPDLPQVWLALGIATYQRHQFQESVDAFLNATRLEPTNIAGWNNLAYALLANSCPQQANRAIICALELAPQDTNIQDSQREIGVQRGGRDRSGCPGVVCPVP